jgi:hypothetical protein
MVIWILMTGLMGCGETSPETLVDELRVVASVALPPEVRPGDAFLYQSFAFNPDEASLESLTWVCTNLGDGCIEAGGGSVSIHTADLSGVAPTWDRSLSISPALSPILEETGPMSGTQVWTLTCLTGLCPVIDDARGLDGLTEWPEDLHGELVDPLDWMVDLPMTGVSLAYQLLTTSLSDTPHENPSLEADSANPTELVRGEQFDLSFELTGEFSEQAQLSNYASAGGFETHITYVQGNGTVVVTGTAPKSGDTVRVWIVLGDGYGGIAVWTAEFPLV